jgi:hypothetical protein
VSDKVPRQRHSTSSDRRSAARGGRRRRFVFYIFGGLLGSGWWLTVTVFSAPVLKKVPSDVHIPQLAIVGCVIALACWCLLLVVGEATLFALAVLKSGDRERYDVYRNLMILWGYVLTLGLPRLFRRLPAQFADDLEEPTHDPGPARRPCPDRPRGQGGRTDRPRDQDACKDRPRGDGGRTDRPHREGGRTDRQREEGVRPARPRGDGGRTDRSGRADAPAADRSRPERHDTRDGARTTARSRPGGEREAGPPIAPPPRGPADGPPAGGDLVAAAHLLAGDGGLVGDVELRAALELLLRYAVRYLDDGTGPHAVPAESAETGDAQIL